MRSWLLIGPACWLLGVAIATAGSLYTVGQLGRGLLSRPAYRVSVAIVTRSPAPAMRAAAMLPVRRRQQRPARPGTAVETTGGTAEAACERGAAYLLYEIPRQGFGIRDLRPGPASTASVTFRNSTGWLVLRVTCTVGGYPAEHVSRLRPVGG